MVTGQTVLTIFSSCARLTRWAASLSNFQGGWVLWLISAMRLRARDALPVLFLVDDDGVRGEAQQADDLGMVGRAQEHDRVALVDELLQLLLLLDHPGAGAVDDLQAARLGTGHDLRRHAMRADDDRGAGVDVVERVDGADALRLELAR